MAILGPTAVLGLCVPSPFRAGRCTGQAINAGTLAGKRTIESIGARLAGVANEQRNWLGDFTPSQ